YLTKPIDVARFLEVVDQALETKAGSGAAQQPPSRLAA
ncbi:MAG: hypothetical protein JWM16_4200, partial [Verrucomicrobiales bacterium]|nr:hypothetical protein [Verrucomicrobiales bacterium]